MKHLMRAVLLGLLLSTIAGATERATAPASIIVPATSTVRGVAATGTVITYTINGTEVQGTVETYKQLAQGQLPVSPGVLYTAPAGIQTFIASIALVNTSGSAVAGVKVFVGGQAPTNQILNTITLPANGSATYSGGVWTVLDAQGAQQFAGTGGTSYTAGAGLTLSSNQFAINPSSDVSWNSHKIVDLANGTAANDAINLGQLTAAIEGRQIKDPVVWCSTGNISLSGLGTQANGEWISTLSAGDRILVPSQSSSPDDGIYAAASGSWTRSSDADTGSKITNASTLALNGVTCAGNTYTQTATITTIGSDPQTWVITSSAVVYSADELTLTLTGTQFSEKNGGTSNAKLANMTAYTVKANPTASPAAPMDATTLVIGVPGFTPTAGSIFSQWTNTRNGYLQFEIQNNNNGASASTDFVATNDQGNDTTHYVDLGINSSGFSGSGSLNIPGGGYLYVATGDLAIGTTDAYGIHFAANNSPTDALLINASNQPVVPGLTGYLFGNASSAITASSTIPTSALSGALQGAQFNASTSVAAAAGTTTLTSASATLEVLTGTGGQTFKLPDATTLAAGWSFEFNNTATGTLSVVNNGSSAITSVPAGGLTRVVALTVGTANGTWDVHSWVPSTASWGTAGLTNVNSAAPASPASGSVIEWTDSTDLRFHDKNASGATGTTVVADTGAANNFLTAISASGVISKAAVVAANISDFASTVRATVLTGLSTATGSVISASDTVLGALGKLQWQITGIKGTYHAIYDFGMVGDQRVTFDGACSTGANTKVTSATMAFVAGDVGKRLTLPGGGASGVTLVGTISAIDSGTQVTISGATCATTVSSKGLQIGTDNTTACNLMVSTINALSYPGSKILFPPSSTNRWACPVTLPFTQGVDLIGQASAVTQDFADYTKSGGTALVWWGTDNDGGTAFQGFVQWSAITANDRPLSGAAMHDIWIDCRNGDQNPCATAVRLVDAVGFDVRNVFVMDALSGFNTATANMTNVTASTGRGTFSNIGGRLLDNTNTPQAGVATAVTLTPTFVSVVSNGQVMTAAGSQSISINAANGFATPGYFWFTAADGSVYFLKCTGGGGTTTLTNCGVSTDGATENPTLVGAATAATASSIVQASPNNGAAFFLQGTATTNSNLFTIDQARWSIGTNYGPAGIEFHNADSITIRQSVMNGGNATNDGAVNRVRRPGVRLGGSAIGSGQASRNNTFYDGDAGTGGVVAMSLSNAGALLAGASGPNYWYRYQTGNGAPVPVIEAVTQTTTQAPVGGIFEWTGNGTLSSFGANNGNGSNATQITSTAASAQFIPGSLIKLPPQWAQPGVNVVWPCLISRTAAGTDTHTIRVLYGTTGATGTDAAILASSASTAGTAVIDIAQTTVSVTWPTIGAAVTPSGAVGRFKTALSATGFGTFTGAAPTMSAMNTGTGQTFMYLALTTSLVGETMVVHSCSPTIVKAALQ